MNNWQLSCGHWVSDPGPHSIGEPFPCKKCDTLRTTIIGYSAVFPSLIRAAAA